MSTSRRRVPVRPEGRVAPRTVVDGVEIVDAPPARVRQPGDLIGMILSAVAIVVVLILSVYAHGMTTGMTADVQTITRVLASILQVVASILKSVAILALPAIVIADLLIRRQPRLMIEGTGAALIAYGVGFGFIELLELNPDAVLVRGLSVTVASSAQASAAPAVAISLFLESFAALLTVVGPRGRRPVLGWSWNLMWIALAIEVVTGLATLPSALVTVLLGRLVGQAARFALGVSTDRATGQALVDGIRKAGLAPVRIVRVRDISDPENPTIPLNIRDLRRALAENSGAAATLNLGVGTSTPSPAPGATGEIPPGVAAPVVGLPGGQLPTTPSGTGLPTTPSATNPLATPLASLGVGAMSDSTGNAAERGSGNRTYAVYDQAGTRWDAVVLDGDRQVVGLIMRTWRTLRLRGMDRRSVVSLRQAAERAALLGYAATAAGVRTPQLVGMGEADDSMFLVQEHPVGLRSICDMRPAEITDEALREIWRQLALAHSCGLAHRAITSDTVLFGPTPTGGGTQPVWLIGWDNGDVASSELARRLDITQMLAMLALRVGAERAVAAAADVLDRDALAAVAPLLQAVALPARTRAEASGHKGVLDTVRGALVDLIPTAETAPFQLTRFGMRTAIIATLTIVAVWVVFTRLNFDQTLAAVRGANPWWMAVAFGLSLVTYVGAALGMIAFTPSRLPFRDTLLTQVAANFVALAAPGGVGPAALNLRLLTKRRVPTALAVATVTLVQLMLFAMTIVLLIVISVVSGDAGALNQVPSTAVVIVVSILALAALILVVPAVRSWLRRRFGPTLTQVWPRIVWVLGQPRRLLIGLSGNILQTMGYILAFWASLQAFDVSSVSFVNVALIYLVGTTAGSAVPTPGGLGTVELALTTGLTAAGLGAVMAAPIAVLFRVITYWARVPLGWLAWRYLQRHDVL